MEIKNQVFLVTGASRGLGQEIAYQLAQRGARLALVARHPEPLNRLAQELRAYTEVVAVVADVAEQAEEIVTQTLTRLGRVDGLINNASTVGPSPMPALAAYPWQSLAQVLRVNFLAPLHLTQLVLPGMLARGQGLIVNLSSDAGVNHYPGWGGYGASKAALEHATRTLAAEHEGQGIGFYLLDPGDMNTQMHQEAEPGVDLSHLPGPQAAADFLVGQLARDNPPFARWEAAAVTA